MRTAMLKPKEGMKIRDPRTGQHLDDKGEEKPLNTYWRRRLKDGDVIEVEVEVPGPTDKKLRTSGKE